MPSKKSKPQQAAYLSKAVHACFEPELEPLAERLVQGIRDLPVHILLEGQMGAGKTTFARALLGALKIDQPAEGSPSFAIAHEYRSPLGEVIHLDLYRIRSSSEIEEAGIPEYFWGRKAVVIAEWTSLWPDLEEAIKKEGKAICIRIDFGKNPQVRNLEIRFTLPSEPAQK